MQIIQTPGFSLEPAIGGVYPLSDFEEALNKIKSGVPGKMILIPCGDRKRTTWKSRWFFWIIGWQWSPWGYRTGTLLARFG